jgi:alpha-glucosidase
MQVEAKNEKYSRKFFPGGITELRREGNTFYFYSEPETILELKVLSDRIIRFRYAPEGKFERDFSYAIAPGYEESIVELNLAETASHYKVSTSLVYCLIRKEDIKITITDHNGLVVNEDEAGFHWMHYLGKGGKIVFNSKKIQEEELFIGLGDKAAALNVRGKRFENYSTDAYAFGEGTDPIYKNIPFYYGLHHGVGYGIFFDNTFRTLFDFGKEREEACSYWARGGEMNYYFIFGPELLTVSQEYTRLTGTPDMPPLWSLGYHQSRWSYSTEGRVLEIAHEFRKRQIPCDALYLDIDYMDGFRCFTFHKENFANAKAMMHTLQEQGFKTVVIIDPGIKVDNSYFVYKEGLAKDVFCRRADGAFMEGDVWPGNCVFPDFTDPMVREWWAELFNGLIETGVRGVWNDMNEPAVFEIGTFPEDVRHNYDGIPCSHRKAHNVYGHLMTRATVQGIKKYLMPCRPFAITRSCYAGIQKFSSVWTGDNSASWEHLWLASQQLQRLSVSGVSFCGSDIGGFIGQPTGELFIRWLQMAVFNGLMRTHSASNEDNFDQEPWSFGAKYEAIAKKVIEMRYRLLPYIYTAFREYSKFGTPLMRPLIFADQHDSENHSRNEEFLFGELLLIAPVVKENQREKKVYLPEGEWYYNWNSKRYKGRGEVIVDAPIEHIPIFIKAGAIVPTNPRMQYIGEKPVKELILYIYYKDGEQKSILYEDAGDNYGYKSGNFNIVHFELKGNKKMLRIRQTLTGNYAVEYDKYKFLLHGLPEPPKEYSTDGKIHQLNERNFAFDIVKLNIARSFHEVVISW